MLLGDSGTGKTHLLMGLGIAACEQARRVRYATCAQLVNELVEAADERRLARLVARYGRLDLLLIDEVGYVQLDTRGAELLFQVLIEREEKSSIGLASNLPFSESGGIIADARLVAAVIDRVTFNAHIIETTAAGSQRRQHERQRPHDVPVTKLNGPVNPTIIRPTPDCGSSAIARNQSTRRLRLWSRASAGVHGQPSNLPSSSRLARHPRTPVSISPETTHRRQTRGPVTERPISGVGPTWVRTGGASPT